MTSDLNLIVHATLVLIMGIINVVWQAGANQLQRSSGDYYTSQHELRKLAMAEQEVAKAVADYVSVLEKRLETAKRFLTDYETSGVAFNSSMVSTGTKHQQNEIASTRPNVELAYPVSAHPLRAYRLLRRYVHDLPTLEKELRSDEERKFLKLTEKVKTKIPFPTQRDMQGATEGILRVHDTYNINIDDFTSGNFYNLLTNTSMSAADCFEIGLYALKSTILTRSIQWLERAYRLVTFENDQTVSVDKVKQKLVEAIAQHNEALMKRSQNPYLFTKPVTFEEALRKDEKMTTRRRVLDGDFHVLREKQSSFNDLTNFAALCSGKQLRRSSDLRKLKCWYESGHSVNTLAPLKIESHSVKPVVIQIHQLISNPLIEKILNAATEKMTRSQVHTKTRSSNKMISSTRTSTSAWLADDQDSTINQIENVYRRVEAFSGLSIVKKGASELFQVSCYGIAGHFNPHLDTVFNSVESSAITEAEKQRGDRLATIMFYLSDVIRGGSTSFPRLGLRIEAVKGSAIFWYNMDDFGNPDQLSLHGGCPILYGNKCVSNKWIRYNPQQRQCQPKS